MKLRWMLLLGFCPGANVLFGQQVSVLQSTVLVPGPAVEVACNTTDSVRYEWGGHRPTPESLAFVGSAALMPPSSNSTAKWARIRTTVDDPSMLKNFMPSTWAMTDSIVWNFTVPQDVAYGKCPPENALMNPTPGASNACLITDVVETVSSDLIYDRCQKYDLQGKEVESGVAGMYILVYYLKDKMVQASKHVVFE